MATDKKIVIYTQKARVELIKDKSADRANLKGVIDFVHYLRYRNSLQGEYSLRAKKFKELKKYFFSQYQIIKAAGGIVLNEYDEVLLIYRRGLWDLPKGKFENNKEKKKECALREVIEETGIKDVEIEGKVKLFFNGKRTTYHTYRYKRKPTIKPVYWYVMRTQKQKLTPQTDEDIEEAIWVKKKHLPRYYNKAYPAIVDILRSV